MYTMVYVSFYNSEKMDSKVLYGVSMNTISQAAREIWLSTHSVTEPLPLQVKTAHFSDKFIEKFWGFFRKKGFFGVFKSCERERPWNTFVVTRFLIYIISVKTKNIHLDSFKGQSLFVIPHRQLECRIRLCG